MLRDYCLALRPSTNKTARKFIAGAELAWVPINDTYRTSAGFGHHTTPATIARNAMFEKVDSERTIFGRARAPIDKPRFRE
jgi:hypothetical protein